MAQVAHATSAVSRRSPAPGGETTARAESGRSSLPLHGRRAPQVLHETRERPETRAYLDDLKNMRKVRLARSLSPAQR